jgi:hypothetical protein
VFIVSVENNKFLKYTEKYATIFSIPNSDCRDGVLNFQASSNKEVTFVRVTVRADTHI